MSDTENKIQALRDIMSQMPLKDTATRRAKNLALEVRRLEAMQKNNETSKQGEVVNTIYTSS